MLPKENTLNAWIMCEQLSEGNINLKDKKIRSFTELINNNYYDFFLCLINEELGRIRASSKKAGIVVYFNIFEFSEVANIFRTEYHLAPTEEEIEMGIKFGLAVSFDQQLNLKDAPIVFMVMGADEISMGGASWAVSGPNMINFAATRAQNAFYIIGDKSLNKSLHSEVAVDTIAIINKYSNEH